MRIGIVTDIHANLPALQVVLDVVDGQAIDYLACLGTSLDMAESLTNVVT